MSEAKLPGMVCAAWWRQTFADDDGAARAARARLRRCATPAEALTIESVHDLNAQLRAAEYRPGADRLALVAIMLAYVSEEGNHRLAEAFGRRRLKDSPRLLSELRFQALVRITEQRELVAPLRRAMAVVRGTPLRVAELAADLYFWNERTRIAWCFQYYDSSNAAPEQGEFHLEETDA